MGVSPFVRVSDVQSDAAIEEACREAGVVNDHQISQLQHGWMWEKWSKVTKGDIKWHHTSIADLH